MHVICTENRRVFRFYQCFLPKMLHEVANILCRDHVLLFFAKLLCLNGIDRDVMKMNEANLCYYV